MVLLLLAALLLAVVLATVTSCCRKLRLNNKKVQQAVVDVDGGLELLQASGFELVFDESSPEPQASAAPKHTTDSPPQGSTDKRLAQSEKSHLKAELPIEQAPREGTTGSESAGQGTPASAVDAAQTEVSNSRGAFSTSL